MFPIADSVKNTGTALSALWNDLQGRMRSTPVVKDGQVVRPAAGNAQMNVPGLNNTPGKAAVPNPPGLFDEKALANSGASLPPVTPESLQGALAQLSEPVVSSGMSPFMMGGSPQQTSEAASAASSVLQQQLAGFSDVQQKELLQREILKNTMERLIGASQLSSTLGAAAMPGSIAANLNRGVDEAISNRSQLAQMQHKFAQGDLDRAVKMLEMGMGSGGRGGMGTEFERLMAQAVADPSNPLIKDRLEMLARGGKSPEAIGFGQQAKNDADVLKESRLTYGQLRGFQDYLTASRGNLADTPAWKLGPLTGEAMAKLGDADSVALHASMNELALMAKKMLDLPSSAFSDSDREFLRDVVGKTAFQKDGIEKIFDHLEDMSKKRVKYHSDLIEYGEKHGSLRGLVDTSGESNATAPEGSGQTASNLSPEALKIKERLRKK